MSKSKSYVGREMALLKLWNDNKDEEYAEQPHAP